MTIPEGVTVREEWAVLDGFGEIYRVADDRQETAEREAALLREGGLIEEPEPAARAAHRWVMETPDGRSAATGWRSTL